MPPQPESLQSKFPNRRFLHITAGQTKTDEMHETADVSSPEYRVKPAKIFNIFSKQDFRLLKSTNAFVENFGSKRPILTKLFYLLKNVRIIFLEKN